MSCRDAKVGDVVIANKFANIHHTITKEGWIGVIKEIDYLGNVIAEGKSPSGVKTTYAIDLDCFDFYQLTTAQELAKKLGFEMGVII